MMTLGSSGSGGLERVLDAPGGFVWWYVDLVDGDGRGAVVLWSFGLPFLPGSRRRTIARVRPSVSVAVYEGGRPVFYLLQEHAEDAAWMAPTADQWRFGDSRFDLRVEGGQVSLRGYLDLPLPAPGGRATGTLELTGPQCVLPTSDGEASPHCWAPVAVPAEACLTLRVGEETHHVQGRGYFDGNRSATPLPELGIVDWRWGRVAMPDHELLYYLLWGPDDEDPRVDHVLAVQPNGRVVPHRQPHARFVDARRSIYGLGWHGTLHLTSASGLDVEVHHRHLVDEGPFYLRTLVEAHDRVRGDVGWGVAERVVPERVDLPWQRPFVRMRRHHAAGDNSVWLPLFSGNRRGRLRRLVQQWGVAS